MAPVAIEENNSISSASSASGSEVSSVGSNGSSHVSDECFGLQETSPDDLHDLLCIGFGPASLAIAVALHDEFEKNGCEHLVPREPKVRFLERQAQFGWHAGMLLPGTKMQISFVKDLATLRDPRSKFTFLNYLKCHNRLVQFSNLDTFLPFRIEFEDYLRWSASHFANVVEYSQEVLQIQPLKKPGGKYHAFEVVSRNTKTGEKVRRVGRNVVIAVGGRPSRPIIFPENHNSILHSSQYKHKISQVLPEQQQPYRIAVVGSGQSAAEVFNDLHSRYPRAHTRLIIRDTALRPSDDSPFVNEVFNPEAVDEFFTKDPETRRSELRSNKATNYSVVRLNLLETIYEALYCQRIEQPDHEKWQHQILTSREVIDVSESAQSRRLVLSVQDNGNHMSTSKHELEVDAVILATGYTRDVHVDMLKDCQHINGSVDGKWTPGRDYKVKLNRKLVEDNAGIYLQGCNEQTHGLSDSLLSILATRSGELVNSILGRA